MRTPPLSTEAAPRTDDTALVLVAHGSRDPRAANATRALVRAVAALRPGLDVRASYLDHAGPRPGEVLTALEAAGYARAILVPLLLTAAYHGRVDMPEVLRTARAEGLRMPAAISEVIGPFDGVVPDLLLAGLLHRLGEVTDLPPLHGYGRAHPPETAGHRAPEAEGREPAKAGIGVPDPGFDAVVLAAAGTNDATARGTVAQAAVALGDLLGVPCTVAYASASAPTGAEAVAALRTAGARRIAIAGYFLAPGRLYDTVVESARSAGGVVAVAPPLTDARDIARLVLSRADAVTVPSTALAA
ncbi:MULTISPECIES: sirohydrochlorin chelatase [Catenuloplanes]|uniref:Sirohydrochlorin ferrochelatase n=1 Tax=Catenuloplanes niger TaxID=587534 RepID=A0AAE3ZT32_9ACTN|nr:CbiX/SirB N-terminal domain-containing protein [Catenuloplanes niger]MDR7324497.1 sirohydrochlorin ferrochelatase [Catenuloplanes niger]